MSALREHLIEALLTLAVLGWLGIFLAPLGNDPNGRNERYASSSPIFAKESLRKAYVQQTLPRLARNIAILAGIGLACLWLGRLRLPTTS